MRVPEKQTGGLFILLLVIWFLADALYRRGGQEDVQQIMRWLFAWYLFFMAISSICLLWAWRVGARVRKDR